MGALRFHEPGLFLVRADGTLYAGAVQTMLFTRPNFGELLRALDFIIPNDYPARDEAQSLQVFHRFSCFALGTREL